MAARQEAEKAGRSGTNAAKASALTGMSLQEAKQVLSIKDVEDVEIIRKVEYLIFSNCNPSFISFSKYLALESCKLCCDNNIILKYSRASIIRTPLVQKPFGYLNSSDN